MRVLSLLGFGIDTAFEQNNPVHPTDAVIFVEISDRFWRLSGGKQSGSRGPQASTMFFVSPDIKDEDLLGHACESLASASVMTSNFAGYLEGPHRHTAMAMAMAIQQIVMLAELAVNRMLDNFELPKTSPAREG